MLIGDADRFFNYAKVSRIDGFAKSPSYPLTVIPSRGGVRDDGQAGIQGEKSHATISVIPAEAGIQSFQIVADHSDSSRTRSGIYRSDDFLRMHQELNLFYLSL